MYFIHKGVNPVSVLLTREFYQSALPVLILGEHFNPNIER